ncbi:MULTISPECIES: GPW/gp25 family protein [unclassified Amycolatopsis]|uniref:GPW/gp25 family protein n=1 Tax=unclassified Amycolatopsis TaxID=2618356 RepID=UPI002E1E4971|nr:MULTISPECIES: GPW/gp25 family protein [unclassified Amycolatopsis]
MTEPVVDQFIGRGWAFPLGVGPTGGIAMAEGHAELVQAMQLILSTYPGERPMRPEFGCPLRDFVFGNVDVDLASGLVEVVRYALRRWEPRVEVEDVSVRPDPDNGSLVYIDIQYTPKATNDQRNLVFPFYTIPDDGGEY